MGKPHWEQGKIGADGSSFRLMHGYAAKIYDYHLYRLYKDKIRLIVCHYFLQGNFNSMKIKEKIISLQICWILPFACFLIGYIFATYLFAVKKIEVPQLVGLPISQGLKKLSDYKLNIRIIAEKEDLDLPSGTIISQKPTHRQYVKPQNAIFVVISKKPAHKKTPYLLNKKINQAKDQLSKQTLNYKIFTLPIQAPSNTVIAQYPAPDTPIIGHIYLYQASPSNQLYLFPDLKQRSLNDVLSFLEGYNIKSTITYKNHQTKGQHIITEQRPLPGTLVSLKQTPHVQLHVRVG